MIINVYKKESLTLMLVGAVGFLLLGPMMVSAASGVLYQRFADGISR